MRQSLVTWLRELDTEFKFSCDPEMNSQACANTHAFSWNQEDRLALTDDDVGEFLRGCASIVLSKAPLLDAVFYSWVDDQAGQLRFSAVVGSNADLPFGCTVRVSTLEEIADDLRRMDTGLSHGLPLNVWTQRITDAKQREPRY